MKTHEVWDGKRKTRYFLIDGKRCDLTWERVWGWLMDGTIDRVVDLGPGKGVKE